MSNDSERVLTFLKHLVLGVDRTIQEEVNFIHKLDILQESYVIVDLCPPPAKKKKKKLLAHSYPLFYNGLNQLILDLDLLKIKFEILNPNASNRLYGDSKFVTPPLQRSLGDWLELLFYRRPRWYRTCYSTIFASIMSFKDFDKLENLTSVWKCVEI